MFSLGSIPRREKTGTHDHTQGAPKPFSHRQDIPTDPPIDTQTQMYTDTQRHRPPPCPRHTCSCAVQLEGSLLVGSAVLSASKELPCQKANDIVQDSSSVWEMPFVSPSLSCPLALEAEHVWRQTLEPQNRGRSRVPLRTLWPCSRKYQAAQ